MYSVESLRRIISAGILSAGSWQERFRDNCLSYPYLPAMMRAGKRIGWKEREVEKAWKVLVGAEIVVVSLAHAREITKKLEEDYLEEILLNYVIFGRYTHTTPTEETPPEDGEEYVEE